MAELHRNVSEVIDAGEALGVTVVPHSYPQGAKTAQDAADAIGVQVGQIVKSLIFGVATGTLDSDLELVLAYVSGSNRLDEKKLAAAAGATACMRVDADTVRSATGFPIGGAPPFGHDTPLRIFIDPEFAVRRRVGRGRNVDRRVPHRTGPPRASEQRNRPRSQTSLTPPIAGARPDGAWHFRAIQN